jgi:hypothetical protein
MQTHRLLLSDIQTRMQIGTLTLTLTRRLIVLVLVIAIVIVIVLPCLCLVLKALSFVIGCLVIVACVT